jgi:hypothetical protein
VISDGTAGSEFEAETQVAVAPDGTIGAAWIAKNSAGTMTHVAYRFSRDGGVSWTPVRLAPTDVAATSMDPSIVATPDGDFYLGFLTADIDVAKMTAVFHVFVGRIAQGTDDFASVTEASSAADGMTFRDHPKMLVMADGTVLIAFMEASSFLQIEGHTRGVVASSSDRGTTWKQSVVSELGQPEYANLYSLCAPADGGTRIYLASNYNNNPLDRDILFRYSDDRGLTWSAPRRLNSGSIGAGGEDPTCAARGDEVWVGFGVSNMATKGEDGSQAQQGIRLAHSPDRGESFGDVVDATDDSTGQLSLHPTLTLAQDGSLHFVFYAAQSDGDTSGALWQRSWNGSTFGPSQRVASPITFELSRTVKSWLGDYIGVTSSADGLAVSYTDNSSGSSHVAFAQVPNN